MGDSDEKEIQKAAMSDRKTGPRSFRLTTQQGGLTFDAVSDPKIP